MAKAAARGASTAGKGVAPVSSGTETRAVRGGNGAKDRLQRPANGRRTAAAQDARDYERALRQLEQALTKAAHGDFKVRLPAKTDDALGRVEAAYNELAARNAALEAELVRVARIIGREGRMTERA